MTLKTTAWDSAVVLDSDEAIEEYMTAAFETGDAAFIARCLGAVARAQNMSALARRLDMSRPSLYKALSGEVEPRFDTILKVMKGLNIDIRPALSGGDTPSGRRPRASRAT